MTKLQDAGQTIRPSSGYGRSRIRQARRNSLLVADLLFYLAFFIWIVLLVLNSSFYARYLQGFIFMGTRAFCLLLLALSELLRPSHSLRSLVGAAIAVVWAYAIMTSHESILLDNLAFIYCGRDRDFRQIARFALICTSFLVGFIIASSLVGIIQNYSAWSGGRTRSYLGFLYALFPAQYLYLITCLAIYLLDRNVTLKHVLILLLANWFVYYYTNSRLSFFSSVLLLIVSWIVAARNRRHPSGTMHRLGPVWWIIAFPSFILSAIASVALGFVYGPGNTTLSLLDSVNIFGGRLAIVSRALHSYPITLFGHELHFVGAALNPSGIAGSLENYNTIDCLYVRMLVNYGVVFTILFVCLFTAVTARALREQNIYLVLVLVSIALRGIVDNLTLHLQYDTFLLLIGMLMSTPQTQRKLKLRIRRKQEDHGKAILRPQEKPQHHEGVLLFEKEEGSAPPFTEYLGSA